MWRGQQPLSHDKLYIKDLFSMGVGKKLFYKHKKKVYHSVSFQSHFKPTATLQAKSNACMLAANYVFVFICPNRKGMNVELRAETMNDPKELKRFSYPPVDVLYEMSQVRRKWLLTGFVVLLTHRSMTRRCGTNQSCACVAIIAIIINSLWFFISIQNYQYSQKIKFCNNFIVTCTNK